MLLCMEWQVHTLEETAAVAQSLLTKLSPQPQATVLALHGDLGAGKTTFVQQFAQALGVTESITSPTYVIQKQYLLTGDWDQLVHIDAYRIEDPDELARLGWVELTTLPSTIICIEWAERVAELLPPDTHHLSLALSGGGRQITYQHG